MTQKYFSYLQTFHFDGYVLEIWNQFVFAGANLQIVTSVVKSIAQKLKKHNLDIILAVPPSRGYLIFKYTYYI